MPERRVVRGKGFQFQLGQNKWTNDLKYQPEKSAFCHLSTEDVPAMNILAGSQQILHAMKDIFETRKIRGDLLKMHSREE